MILNNVGYAMVENGDDVTTINSTLDDFSAQARKGVSRLVASYQQDGDAKDQHDADGTDKHDSDTKDSKDSDGTDAPS